MTLAEKINLNLKRNKKLYTDKYNGNNKQQSFFISLLNVNNKCVFANESEYYKKGTICPVDDCTSRIVVEKYYFCPCTLTATLVEMFSDPMTSKDSSWMRYRSSVTAADDLLPFVVDILLELGYVFTINKFPNLRENLWRRVVGDKNARSTLDVPPILDMFMQTLAMMIPPFSFHLKNVKFDDDIAVFYSCCEHILSEIKHEEFILIQDKYECKLVKAIMHTYLNAFDVGSSVFFFPETFYFVKDKPDIYYYMSQLFKTFGPSSKSALTESPLSYGVHEALTLFIGDATLDGLFNGLSYIYKLCVNVSDKKLHLTLQDMMNIKPDEAPMNLTEIQQAFFDKFSIMSFDLQQLHLADLLSGCFGNSNSNVNSDPEMESIFATMRGKQYDVPKYGTRHIMLDTDLFSVIDKEFVVNQQLGGSVFSMLVSSSKGLLTNGTRMPIYPVLTRLLASTTVVSKRWLVSIMHFLLFDDVTAALDAQKNITTQQDATVIYDSLVACMSFFIAQNTVDLFMAANARVVAYKLLLLFINLSMAVLDNEAPARQSFLETCFKVVGSPRTPISFTTVSKTFFCAPPASKGWKYSHTSKLVDADKIKVVKSAISLAPKKRTFAVFTDAATIFDCASDNDKAMGEIAAFFAVLDMVCVMNLPPAIALWHYRATDSSVDHIKTHAIPCFYSSQREDYIYDENMFVLPNTETQRAWKTSTVQLGSVCVDKPVKDCRAIVLGGEKELKPFQLYKEFEGNAFTGKRQQQQKK